MSIIFQWNDQESDVLTFNNKYQFFWNNEPLPLEIFFNLTQEQYQIYSSLVASHNDKYAQIVVCLAARFNINSAFLLICRTILFVYFHIPDINLAVYQKKLAIFRDTFVFGEYGTIVGVFVDKEFHSNKLYEYLSYYPYIPQQSFGPILDD